MLRNKPASAAGHALLVRHSSSHRSAFRSSTRAKQFARYSRCHQIKTLPKGECFDLPMGDVVEDVRTVFEKLQDETIYIPTMA